MEALLNDLANYGVVFVIVAIFLWDYIANKKKLVENQDVIKNTLITVKDTTSTLSDCLKEMQQTNLNTAKSLDLLQKQMDTTDRKIDTLLGKKQY